MEIKSDCISNIISGIVINTQAIVLCLLNNIVVVISNYFGNKQIKEIDLKSYTNRICEIKDLSMSPTNQLILAEDRGFI